MAQDKTIIFNNGKPMENIQSAIVINGTPNLTPRAYNLLNILSKKLMEKILSTKSIHSSILDTVLSIAALREISISVEEYMDEVSLENYFLARENLAQAGMELHSFFISFHSNLIDDLTVMPQRDWETSYSNVGFIQCLTGSGKIYDDNGRLELEFYPDFVRFLSKKYRSDKYQDMKAEDYSADQLLLDLVYLGLSYISDYGFVLSGNFLNLEDMMVSYIRDHYCQGPAPQLTKLVD